MADVFVSLGLDRRAALWQALEQEEELPLFAGLEPTIPPVPLPRQAPVSEMMEDYRTVGLSLRAHPLEFLRPALDELRVVSSRRLLKLSTGRKVRVAGLVLLRQRPSTAGGITFVTLEDETGTINLVIRPQTWEKYRRAARSAVVMLVDGRLERKDEIVHVLAERLSSYTSSLDANPPGSRDFR
jgi:error-prone DNA polymerase